MSSGAAASLQKLIFTDLQEERVTITLVSIKYHKCDLCPFLSL